MLYIILSAILGLVVGGGITYLVCRKLPQDKIRQINEETFREEQRQKRDLQQKIDILDRERELKTEQVQSIQNKIASIEAWAEEKAQMAKQLVNQQKELAEQNAMDSLDSALASKAQQFQEQEEAYQKEYLEALAAAAKEFESQVEQYQKQIGIQRSLLASLERNVASAVEAAKRAEAEQSQKDFYRIQLQEIDIDEIAKIRSIEPMLRNKEALNKVIWKVYYEKPVNDLIGRVVGSTLKMGIYKITNLNDEKCYVGQSRDIAARWKQHIKRGVGAETPTRNKLYPAMLSIGVENFTFEIVEECTATELNEREKYWINYFQSKEYGYNVTAGGA